MTTAPTRTRAQAYADYQLAETALTHMRRDSRATPAQIAEEERKSAAAYAEYRAWVKADNAAGQAGAYEGLEMPQEDY